MTPPVTFFAPAQLQKIVDETLPAVPAGKRGALVGTIDTNGAQVVVGFRLDDAGDWRAQGAYRHDWNGNNTIGASIIGTF